MKLIDIQAQIEDELTWRVNEIRFLRNQLGLLRSDSEKMVYRKALVVMLYSHFEGFARTAFLIYVKSINQENLPRSVASDFIVAASLADVFKAYEDPQRKCSIFKRSLPNDASIHEFFRQVELVMGLNDLWKEKVDIPEDVVNVGFNLRPVVLRKILYRLGFPHDSFQPFEGHIQHLLNLRNSIAHGAAKAGVDQKQYDDIEKVTLTVMEELKKIIMDALASGLFYRVPLTS